MINKLGENTMIEFILLLSSITPIIVGVILFIALHDKG